MRKKKHLLPELPTSTSMSIPTKLNAEAYSELSYSILAKLCHWILKGSHSTKSATPTSSTSKRKVSTNRSEKRLTWKSSRNQPEPTAPKQSKYVSLYYLVYVNLRSSAVILPCTQSSISSWNYAPPELTRPTSFTSMAQRGKGKRRTSYVPLKLSNTPEMVQTQLTTTPRCQGCRSIGTATTISQSCGLTTLTLLASGVRSQPPTLRQCCLLALPLLKSNTDQCSLTLTLSSSALTYSQVNLQLRLEVPVNPLFSGDLKSFLRHSLWDHTLMPKICQQELVRSDELSSSQMHILVQQLQNGVVSYAQTIWAGTQF